MKYSDVNEKPKVEQRIIGLTGGISCGKTTVSNYIATHHAIPVFDADIFARMAVEKSSPILDNIAARYGTNILLADGQLNRKQLGNIIFNNPEERHWLEQQIHPYVRDRFIEAINKSSEETHPILVLDVPLLFEANMTDLVTEIWVVSCNEQEQIKRLMARDRLSSEQAEARIKSQISLQEKCDQADVVLDNSSTLEDLLKQVDLALFKGINRNLQY